MQTYFNYKSVAEQEKSKRDAIQAARDCYVAQVKASRKSFERYLDLTFKEIRENFDKYFDALDQAMKNDDINQMSVILSGINNLVEQSPLKDAQNFMTQIQSSTPNDVIDF